MPQFSYGRKWNFSLFSAFFSFYLHIKFGTVHPQKFIKLLWVGAVKAIFCLGLWTNFYVSSLGENRYKGSEHSWVLVSFVKIGSSAKSGARRSCFCYRRKLDYVEACIVNLYGILRVKNGLIICMYCITKNTIYSLVLLKIHSLYTNDNLYLPMFELTIHCDDCFLLLYMRGRQCQDQCGTVLLVKKVIESFDQEKRKWW
jgi:hypothetical protein